MTIATLPAVVMDSVEKFKKVFYVRYLILQRIVVSKIVVYSKKITCTVLCP